MFRNHDRAGEGLRIRRSAAFLIALFSVLSIAAGATGIARVQQRDGAVKTYRDVHIRIADRSMSITSSDGKGTLTISKAACSVIGQLMRCLPYAVVLDQNGFSHEISLQTGTVYLNPSGAMQPLPRSSTQIPPHGVLASIRTKAGTYMSLEGIVDELKR